MEDFLRLLCTECFYMYYILFFHDLSTLTSELWPIPPGIQQLTSLYILLCSLCLNDRIVQKRKMVQNGVDALFSGRVLKFCFGNNAVCTSSTTAIWLYMIQKLIKTKPFDFQTYLNLSLIFTLYDKPTFDLKMPFWTLN